MEKLTDDRLEELGAKAQIGEGLFCLDTVDVLSMCLELRSLRSIMRSVEGHDEWLRIQFADVDTLRQQQPLPFHPRPLTTLIDDAEADRQAVASGVISEEERTRRWLERKAQSTTECPVGASCSNIACGYLHTGGRHGGIEDPRVKAGAVAAHPDKPQGIAALLDPRCECGHVASDHVGRTGPCRRTPCGVKCRCDVMTVKV